MAYSVACYLPISYSRPYCPAPTPDQVHPCPTKADARREARRIRKGEACPFVRVEVRVSHGSTSAWTLVEAWEYFDGAWIRQELAA